MFWEALMKEKGLWAGSGRTSWGSAGGQELGEGSRKYSQLPGTNEWFLCKWFLCPYLGTPRNLQGCQFWFSCISAQASSEK